MSVDKASRDSANSMDSTLIDTSGRTLAFDGDEYSRRLRLIRIAMKEAGLDVLLLHSPENIYYLSGQHSLGYLAYQCLAVPLTGSPVAIIRAFEESNVRTKTWVREFASYGDSDDPIATTVATLVERGHHAGCIGLEKSAWFLTASACERLMAALPAIEWSDGSLLVDRIRLVKSKPEIDEIRRAARICEASLLRAEPAIRAGNSENDVASALYQGMIEAGGEYVGHPPLVTSGPRTGLAFGTWAGRRLEPGDMVKVEPLGASNRYHAAMLRMYAIGAPSDLHRRMFEASLAALDAGQAAIQPGAAVEDIHHAVARSIVGSGFEEYFRHRSGYSIGIGFPPDPSEGRALSIRPGQTQPLQPGMVLFLTPGLAIKTVVGVAVDDTVLVTETGSELLTQHPRELSFR